MSVIAGAAVVLPRWARGPVRVEGPDEDSFTLLVRAGELLRRAVPLAPGQGPAALRLLSDLCGEERADLFDAWGLDPVPVTAFPLTSEGARAALAASLDEDRRPEEPPTWTLIAQIAAPSGSGVEELPKRSAGACAFALVGSPPLPAPPTAGSTDGDGASSGDLTVVPPAQIWRTGSRGGPEGSSMPPLAGSRGGPDDPLTIFLTLARAAVEGKPGEPGAWLHATEEVTALRVLVDGRTVPVLGLSEEDLGPSREVSEGAWKARAGTPLGMVSQGAYLSQESYRASIPERWRLEGEQCGSCGAWNRPSSGRCAGCGRKDRLVRKRLPLQGATLETSTLIHRGAQPTEFDYHQETFGPYAVGLVRFLEGPRLTFQCTDPPPGADGPSAPASGTPVELVLRRLYPQEGAWRYGLKAVPQPRSPSLRGERTAER